MALSNLQTHQERTGTLSLPMENVIVWTFLLPLFAFVRVTTTGNVPRTLPSPCTALSQSLSINSLR